MNVGSGCISIVVVLVFNIIMGMIVSIMVVGMIFVIF